MQPQTPNDFSNPASKEIKDLEKEYAKGLKNGTVFSELKTIRQKIKLLKLELGISTEKTNKKEVE